MQFFKVMALGPGESKLHEVYLVKKMVSLKTARQINLAFLLYLVSEFDTPSVAGDVLQQIYSLFTLLI